MDIAQNSSNGRKNNNIQRMRCRQNLLCVLEKVE